VHYLHLSELMKIKKIIFLILSRLIGTKLLALVLTFSSFTSAMAIQAQNSQQKSASKTSTESEIKLYKKNLKKKKKHKIKSKQQQNFHAEKIKSKKRLRRRKILNKRKDKGGSFAGNFQASGRQAFESKESEQNPVYVFAASLGYSLSSRYALGASTSYYHEMVEYDDQRNNGMGNTDLYFSNSNLYSAKNRGFNMDYSIGSTLPTAQKSKEAGLQAGYWGQLGLNQKLGAFILSNSNILGYNIYRWETANRGNTVYNEPLYFSNSLMLAIPFYKHRFRWSAGVTWFNGQNTVKNWNHGYKISTSLFAKLTEQFAITANLATQDQYTEINNLFEPDQSYFTLGIQWNI